MDMPDNIGTTKDGRETPKSLPPEKSRLCSQRPERGELPTPTL